MTKNYCFKNWEENTESTGQLCLSKNKKENFNKWKSKPIRVMRSHCRGGAINKECKGNPFEVYFTFIWFSHTYPHIHIDKHTHCTWNELFNNAA